MERPLQSIKAKDLDKLPGRCLFKALHILFRSGKRFQTTNPLIPDPTGDDPGVVVQVGVDVEGEAMHGYSPGRGCSR